MTSHDVLAALTTEDSDPRYAAIDTQSVDELARLMNEADATVPAAVNAALPQIVPAIEALVARMSEGGRLVYVGAGTPGRIGVLDASECPPTFNTPPELVFGIIAGGPIAVSNPVEGAEDDSGAGAAAIDEAGIGPLDTVIGIASSGRTPYVVAAVERARQRGALTVGLSCNPDTELSAAAEHGIEVNVGPEFVSGSTRLKAGTAQKLVLNMFSTIAMVRLGKTYGNLMVDVRATNHKLRERAIRMVAQIAQVGRDVAERALVDVDFDVKTASVMLVKGVGRAEAGDALDEAGRRLRVALEAS
ncbi:N-acetylmuramic acid 6-phosphate etherase [Microbacterium sp. AG1240]|uniref:N-acetylmuramic acid 6-phosphate etherase n=1 Tax=Microbacterium sp. AG1240 TaxID=2183992 RepID=UPI000EACA52E|nr:N-acetylmuramic acid 6-phosphate etherase [Microbacterium sp. AG1240]RKT31507.1 N-acetylmuramic acid 6-phosphate etherase [Microbacterium sp. AG1240]